MPTEPRIVNPLQQNFSCDNCGFCCSNWKVKVDPEKIPELEATDAYRAVKASGYVPLRVLDEDTATTMRPDGFCAFHDGGGCSIHREKGMEAKPTVCQMFPFSLVNSPDGYYLSLSFSCPSVLKGTGQPVSQQVDSLQKAVSASSFFVNGPMDSESHVALTSKRAISWPQYLTVEQGLLANLDRTNPTLSLLDAALLLIEHATDRIDWSQVRPSSELKVQTSRLFPFYFAYTVASLENSDSPESLESYCGDLLEGKALPSNLLSGQPLPEFQLYKPVDDTTQTLIERYVQNLVLGKQLLSGGPFVSRLLMLSVSVAVLLFYLQARTNGGSRAPVHDDHVWCFHLVETCILSHTEVLASLFAHFESELKGP